MSLKNLIKNGITLSLLCTSSMLFAQQNMQKRTPEERAQNQTQWMQKNLGLSQMQYDKAYDINLYYAREVSKLNRNEPPGPDKKMDNQGLRHDKDAELKQVLTAQQYQGYQQHMREMKEKMHERRSSGQQGGGY